jgi:hypothetical protein
MSESPLDGEDPVFTASRPAVRELFFGLGVTDIRVVLPIARDEVVFVLPATVGGVRQEVTNRLIGLLDRKVLVIAGSSPAWEARAHSL